MQKKSKKEPAIETLHHLLTLAGFARSNFFDKAAFYGLTRFLEDHVI